MCSCINFLLLHVAQLYSTTYGTMKATPYELVFGQPAQQNIFPDIQGDMIYEEDLEDLIVGEEEEENQNYPIGANMQENTSQRLKKPHEHYDFAKTEASDPVQERAYDPAAEYANSGTELQETESPSCSVPQSEFQQN